MSVNSIEPLLKAIKEDEISNEPTVTKTVKLVRSNAGYGIYLREAMEGNKVRNFVPTKHKPSTQLIIDCDEGGVAEKAGLKAGDFIVEVNNEDVRQKPHSELLALIGSLKEEVVLKVVHVPKFKLLSFEAKKFKSEEQKEIEQEKIPDERREKVCVDVEPPLLPDLPAPIAESPTRSESALHLRPRHGTPPSEVGSSPSARRRRIKVLPKSESDDLIPADVFEVSAGTDPNKKQDYKSGPQRPVRILPHNCDSATIWEQAKIMQARRRVSSSTANDDSFIPDTKPADKTSTAILEACADHPYKWDVYQTSVWLKSCGLEAVAAIFKYNEIQGEHLKYISKDDLRDIDINDEPTLNKIAKQIEILLTKYDSSGRV